MCSVAGGLCDREQAGDHLRFRLRTLHPRPGQAQDYLRVRGRAPGQNQIYFRLQFEGNLRAIFLNLTRHFRDLG